MRISDERLQELQRIYRQEYGEDITLPRALELGGYLLTLYGVLKRPLPDEGGVPACLQHSPAQSEP